jgi:hypothetical protein
MPDAREVWIEAGLDFSMRHAHRMTLPGAPPQVFKQTLDKYVGRR